MPPWVARPCHVLRAPPCAIAVLPRVQRPPRCARDCARRSYAQDSKQDDTTLKLSTSNSAIIIPSSVVDTQPEDLVAHIEPVDRRRLSRDRFAVFFVTPTFAPWLLDDETFLHKALRRAYKHIIAREKLPYARIHALCAVVDKLPTPSPITNIEALQNGAPQRTRQPPVLETGHEGMAYTTLRFSDSVSSSSPIADDKAAISFISSADWEPNGYFGDTLRLPVANTVFQTGLPTTMTFSTWEKGKGAKDLTLKSKQSITHHGIKIHPGGSTTQCVTALAIPLVPLTMPRRVDASMGNILRRVIDAGGKSVTASEELEQVVPQYFTCRGEPSQAASVWALVIPKETLSPVLQKTRRMLGRLRVEGVSGPSLTQKELWEALWQRDPPLWNDLVPTALAAGARLHRVLSGGGGWGKKAGLLSLDPVATTERFGPSVMQGDTDLFDGPGDLSAALQQVAHDGDSIQFFISPTTTQAEAGELNASTESAMPWGWELGTIPSTADALPMGSSQHDVSKSNEVFVFRDCFGALTEGGMTLDRRFKLESGDSFSRIGSTIVDVPFSRFSAVNLASGEEGPEEDVGGPEENM